MPDSFKNRPVRQRACTCERQKRKERERGGEREKKRTLLNKPLTTSSFDNRKFEAMQYFSFLCPRYNFVHFPVVQFHKRMALSNVAARIKRPFGEN